MTGADDTTDLTNLIRRAQRGDERAADELFRSIYPELRRMARLRLRKHTRNTLLDTTELVHESYLRFVSAGRLSIEDRAHFLGYTGKIMRSVIVDAARERIAKRRGGASANVTLNSRIVGNDVDGAAQILEVHDALEALAQQDARLVQVVELRYFAGMTELQIAGSLGIAERTVRRDWEKARLLLAEQLS
jgi:RNA polymerase sigma factor (TIGR02999 family)